MKKALKIVGLVLASLVGLIVLLVGYAGATGSGKLQFPGTPLPQGQASTDPAVIEQGRYLVHSTAHCAQCHSTSERDRPELIKTTALHGGLEFAMGPLGTRYAANLTPDKLTGIGGHSDAQVLRTIRTGVLSTGELSILMRLAAARPSDEDTIAILSYLRSVQPEAHAVPSGEWKLFAKVLLTYFMGNIGPRDEPAPKHVPPSDAPSLERGQYLAEHVMVCTGCHSKFDMNTFKPVGPKAGGGDPDPSHGSDSDMEFVTPNLTSHPTGITGKLDEAAFVARLRAGRAFKSSIMPWENFSTATDADLKSVYMYLRSLPPVDHDVGLTYRKRK